MPDDFTPTFGGGSVGRGAVFLVDLMTEGADSSNVGGSLATGLESVAGASAEIPDVDATGSEGTDDEEIGGVVSLSQSSVSSGLLLARSLIWFF